MDSITQAALGATIAGAVAGKSLGRSALVAGAVLGTLPDLDVVIDYGTAVANFTQHRGFSHSLLILVPLVHTFVTDRLGECNHANRLGTLRRIPHSHAPRERDFMLQRAWCRSKLISHSRLRSSCGQAGTASPPRACLPRG